MKVVEYKVIKDELLSHLKRKMLLPIIGSGFTRDCIASNGKVPSGADYRQYMINSLIESNKFTEKENEEIKNQSFSNICDIYYELTDINARKRYLRDNFTGVYLEENKKRFLSMGWPYIYTLNIDDGIEKNSNFDCIVCSNRQVDEDILNEKRCVIKLHGDVWEMLKYNDDKSEIFSRKQYVDSLVNNSSLLGRLKHDSMFQNLIYIGCSLDDEIDLLSIDSNSDIPTVVKRYMCLINEPSNFQKIKFKRYGITHCIVFDSYDSMYNELVALGEEAQKVSVDELHQYKTFSFKKCTEDYNDNKGYLLHGKSLIDKQHKVTMPYFFISRDHTNTLIKNLEKYSLQFVVGPRCSGKTYTLFDLLYRVKDKDTYIFETKDRLTEAAFQNIIQKENSIILFDNASLSAQQIEYLIKNLYILNKRNIRIILVINKSERDILGVRSLCIKKEIISEEDVPIVNINNKFNDMEISVLNPLLTTTGMGIFRPFQTVLDNILYISDSLKEKSKYDSIIPKTNNLKLLASLIILATERKVYSSRAVLFDVYNELGLQKKSCEPLVDVETTWSFERSSSDNSPFKYVLNAEFWLCRQLSFFARNKDNCTQIVLAYKYIIEKIIENDQGPNIHFVNKKGTYKEYILFDNINRIFNTGSLSGKEGLLIAKSIYDGLNSLLSIDPNYMHQRAKCYIKLSQYEKVYSDKIECLNKAFRDVNVSIQLFEQRYAESLNENILISLDHLKYTMALIHCHKCYINKYNKIDENSDPILLLHEALISPFNSYEYARKDTFNYNNVISNIVYETIANHSLVNEEAKKCLSTLFNICGGVSTI